MLKSASKSLPAIDYVSIVASVYKDRRQMVVGTLATAVAAAATGVQSGSPVLLVHAGLFIAVMVVRYLDMSQFARARLAPDDVEGAARWELRATILAVLTAAVFGSWCLSSLVLVDSAFAALTSISVTVAAMVGVVGRNFGLDRMLTLQLLVFGALTSTGLLLKADIFYLILASLLVPMTASMRFAAADVRAILLNAVHGRIEASRLADELDAALDTLQHGLCMLDKSGRISVANDRAINAFTQMSSGPWSGRQFTELLEALVKAEKLPPEATGKLARMVEGHGAGKLVISIPNGHSFEVTVSSRLERTVVLFEDITDRIRAQQRITFMAAHDSLTGLHNRIHFSETVSADLAERAVDVSRADHVALMIFDIDDFKHVNDTLGHLAGDRLLVEAAERIRAALPDGTVIARLGGDEFVSYRSGILEPPDALRDAESIRAAFAAPFAIAGQSLNINISVGVAVTRERIVRIEQLMTNADLALYQAKGNGKAQVRLFHDEMDVAYRYRQRLIADLRAAVAEGKLNLAYQPIIDIHSRRVVGCEALARWVHPQLGAIPPSVFIPLAEEIGLISAITRFVLLTAARECAGWPDPVRVAVNISAHDFTSGDIIGMVNHALAGSGLPARRLEIEITETAVIEERDNASAMLSKLLAQGVSVALDDFGTGYSSLSYLEALPFTKLKIDRSFVSEIGTNPRALKLLANVSRLGKDIQMIVTAEGVETEEQLDLIVRHTAVDEIQGYLFGVPLGQRDIAELIRRIDVGTRPQEERKAV